MKKKTFVEFVALSLFVLILSACGGADRGSSGEFEVTVDDDFAYSPSTLSVSAGQEVVITFVNNASVQHTFNIAKKGAELGHVLEEEDAEHREEEMHEILIFEMHEVTAGNSGTGTFTAPLEAGDYVIFCSIPGHFDAGLSGTLQVSQ